ncbi:hypothetical protein BgAZ_106330 [Babesia gibsoni]|uniref:Exonuclease domain-containing protein n=1 Tax=Babesia gibsoni TaxID=33632 RepID=A0AAD8PGD8_BABGI|nr:hypothetical protein BgAZ_106330 [Babesia gibsoni]
MQYGIVKYDQWEDLIWVYNSLDSYINTPLTGAIVGIKADDKEVKYANWMSQSQGGYNEDFQNSFNAYCGCNLTEINAVEPYDIGLIIATGRGVDILNRDGGRRMRVTSEKAERHITNGGSLHIACSLLSCSSSDSRALLATNSNELYALDSFCGQLSGKMKVQNDHLETTEFLDKITVLGDMNGNMSRSSCMMTYYHTYLGTTDFTDIQYQPYDYANSDTSGNNTSLESIAKGFGSIDAIPEFIPSSKRFPSSNGTMSSMKMPPQKTSGAISLEYAMSNNKTDHIEHAPSKNITLVGMLSGLLHIIDHRMKRIAYTIAAHASAVSAISAYGNSIVTTGCYLYGNSLVYEPLVEVHDIRMERSTSIWLGQPVCSAKIVRGTNKVVALNNDGSFFECTIGTQEKVHYPNLSNNSAWNCHDVDIRISGGSYGVYTADEGYSVNFIDFEIKEDSPGTIAPVSLKPIYQKVLKGQVKLPNNTSFASLEGTFPGDVAHVFVQVFFFLNKLGSLSYHCCEVEHCLACHVGFALHMLKVAHENRKNGHIEDNYFSKISKRSEMQVTQLQELMPIYKSESTACAVQSLLIWVIEKVNSELDNYYSRLDTAYANADVHLIKNVFGFSKIVKSKCANGHTSTKEVENDLFMDYIHLKSGKAYEEEMTAYCVECSRPVMIHYTTEFNRPPNFMIVRCEQDGITEVQEHMTFDGNNYTLVTVMFCVTSEYVENRLLAYVRVPKEMQHDQEWLLINDGYVFELSEEDISQMLDFSPRWKQAITLIYRKDELGDIKGIEPTLTGDITVVNINGRIVPLPIPDEKVPIPSSIFISEYNIAHNPRAHDKNRTFVPLSVEELVELHNGEFIVALDVECVKTGNETTGSSRHLNMLDNHSAAYGSSNVAQRNTFLYVDKNSEEQQHSTLARVSAVRGTGHAIGVPFLDHYIHRRKPPKDYLTRFSGIHRGDLDLKSSLHWLTTRKAIYMKIRYLIDAGCKILGHGLQQDFRMLNIVVPKEQVIDTVELFRLPGQRYISLQFLAAHLLNRRIQQEEHNSVEDAKTALDLYKKYLEYKMSGKLEDTLKSLYDTGYKNNWIVS